ncbi:hypothetical protein Pint_22985 [Pistacia integerrima]|uniref:Uncharacterized protein n=1 Tax=Pistacia integerrima TaxID=434235 RepID=A0ACC0YME8_9ROSI|nr:hypothetical protein Pint_22985 [Pistacia integerrima]
MFNVGKYRLVKYWDADKFELLLTLEGHHADVWCLAISNSGDYIVTGSHDRSIRHWDRIEEPISLSGVPENAGKRKKRGWRKCLSPTLTMQCKNALDIVEEELDRIAQHEKRKPGGNVAEFQPDIRMLGLSPSHYVLRTLSNVKTNDLEQTLLGVTICGCSSLSYLKDWASNPDKVILFALWNI